MLKKAIAITAFLSALGAGHSAMAQPPPGGGGPGGGFTPPAFADYDKDKNGKITKEEIAAFYQARAAAAPGGGAAGPGAGRPAPDPEAILARWDADKDGSVSQAEFDSRPRGGGGPGGGGPGGGRPPQ